MTISPAQSRAARALLNWSQDDLSQHSHVAKKSIADFERGSRNPHDRTVNALRDVLEAFGVEFIPQNGGGDGVRFRIATPRILFRRDDVEHRQWIAFAFDYKSKRQIGFVEYDALAKLTNEARPPLEVFDEHRGRILLKAAEKTDATDFDPEGRVLLRADDMPIIDFNAESED